MLKQLIIEKKNLPIKYHGDVTHIIFECNNCHKQFIQKESYYKKQLKRRQFACCFCSPSCRTRYQISQHIPINKNINTETKLKTMQTSKNPKENKSILIEKDNTKLKDEFNPNQQKDISNKKQTNGFLSSFLKGLLGK